MQVCVCVCVAPVTRGVGHLSDGLKDKVRISLALLIAQNDAEEVSHFGGPLRDDAGLRTQMRQSGEVAPFALN